jgi:hypothetical protein
LDYLVQNIESYADRYLDAPYYRRLDGIECDLELQDAWSAAYTMLARTMLEAAPTSYPAGNFYGHLVRGVMTSQYGVSEVAAPLEEQAAPKPSTASVLSTAD